MQFRSEMRARGAIKVQQMDGVGSDWDLLVPCGSGFQVTQQNRTLQLLRPVRWHEGHIGMMGAWGFKRKFRPGV